ncbi:hypothetical protein ANN_24511, partial [Periplaneta americana]
MPKQGRTIIQPEWRRRRGDLLAEDDNLPAEGEDENLPAEEDENIPAEGEDENLPAEGEDENLPAEEDENIPEGEVEDLPAEGEDETTTKCCCWSCFRYAIRGLCRNETTGNKLKQYSKKVTLPEASFIDFFACKLFNSKQGTNEGVANWGSRIDAMSSDLTEAMTRLLPSCHHEGAIAFLKHISKVCFIQSLHDERVQTIVRARDEKMLLPNAVEIALEEESAILSGRFKKQSLPQIRNSKPRSQDNQMNNVNKVTGYQGRNETTGNNLKQYSKKVMLPDAPFIDFFACKLFNSKQDTNEGVANWGSRIDAMSSFLTEAMTRLLTSCRHEGAIAFLKHISKVRFIQDLHEERVKTI